jgi:hypothetical protein
MPRAHVASAAKRGRGEVVVERRGCVHTLALPPPLRTGSSLPPPLPWTWKCKSVFFSIFYVSRSVGLLIEVNVLRTTTGANICRALNSYNVDAIALEKILLIC